MPLLHSPERQRFSVSVILILAVLLLVGWALLNDQKMEKPVSGFQKPDRFLSSAEAPLYSEEVIDPDTNYSMAHVASMAELPDGTLAATWYAGSGEVRPDVKIYFSTQKPYQQGQSRRSLVLGANSKTNELTPKLMIYGTDPFAWSAPQIIMTREQASCDLQRFIKGLGNALLFAEHDGTLRLLYVTISIGKWSGSILNLTSSRDAGKTWEKSQRLFLSPFFNLSELVKNAPVPLAAGGWAVPIYQEFLGKFPEILWLKPDQNNSLIATKTRIAGGCSFFQPAMTALSAQSAVVFCRDYLTSEKIWRTQTTDGGRSWAAPKPIALPNHDSGIASVRLSNGWLLLAFNDSATSRDTLCLALSKDEGITWKRIAIIAKEPQGDFSYPYFLQTHDGLVHLLYSWKRRHIHHVVFNESWVVQSSNEQAVKSKE